VRTGNNETEIYEDQTIDIPTEIGSERILDDSSGEPFGV
jgi:hypothetical protein